MVKINIVERSRADKDVNLKVMGLTPNQVVTIRATSSDYYCINADIRKYHVGDTWESYGVFNADSDGCIDLSQAKSLDGSYVGYDQMGLFTSMIRVVEKDDQLKTRLAEISENRQYTITIRVEADGNVLAEKMHIRYFCDDSIQSQDITQPNLTARYFTTKDGQPRSAIIVVSGSDGRIEKASAIAQLFAMEGYSALAVGYFGLDSTAVSLNKIPLEIIQSGIAWLQKQVSVDENSIMIYGRSKGGEMALAAASLFPGISRIVASVPGGYIYEGLSKNMLPSKHSSWTYRGQELPCLKFTFGLTLKMGLKMMMKQKNVMPWIYNELLSKAESEKAVIKVENINAPILFISSDTDEIWTSKDQCERMMKRLELYDSANDCKHITYNNAGHMLTIANQSIPKLNQEKRCTKEWADANRDAWHEVLDFLRR